MLGGRLPEDYHETVALGKSPRSEFGVFVRRNDAKLVSLADMPAPRSRIGRLFSTIQGGRLPLAWWASGTDHAAIVTSGEDVGLPLALATLRRRTPPPVLIVVHGFFIETTRFRVMLALLRHAGHVHLLCLSQSLRDSIVERFRFPPSRCHAAGYGVDTVFFSPETPASPRAALIASAGAANRDYPTLVAAVESLEVPVRIASASVWITGPTGLEQMPLSSFVEARSYGNYVNLRALYASASIIVVPLLPVNFASGYTVIAEAMAMGRPVIATPDGGAERFHRRWRDGHLRRSRRRCRDEVGHRIPARRCGSGGSYGPGSAFPDGRVLQPRILQRTYRVDHPAGAGEPAPVVTGRPLL